MESTAELYSVVRDLGESVTIQQTINNLVTTINAKMGVIPATKAAYNLIDRAFLLWGDLALDIGDDCPKLEGAYITREIEPDEKYLLYSCNINPGYSQYLSEIYCSKCTDLVNLKRKVKTYDAWGNVQETFQDYAEDVDACCNTQPKNDKITSDGTFDQAIYSMVIPARYCLSRGDRVGINGFVAGVEKELTYEVDSVVTSLISKDANGKIYGITQCQMSYVEDAASTEYSIAETLTHCTASSTNVDTIATDYYIKLQYTAATGYSLPSTVTVSGASHAWDRTQGILILYSPTASVSVTITAVAT